MTHTQIQPEVRFTDHARRRAQSRGIKLQSVELATRFGRKTRVPGGLFQRFFSKQCAKKARRAGIEDKVIEAAIGTPIICAENELGHRVVVSVLPRNALRRAA